MNQFSRADIDVLIQERLENEPGFRARLKSEPAQTLSELCGIEIPDAVVVEVHEETPTRVHLVIPSENAEISEDDLALVNGGWGLVPVSEEGSAADG